MPTFRIHPAIGVARIGNSDRFFVGPEQSGIPANWNSQKREFESFKDPEGKILRQAARFRVCEFDEQGRFTRELTPADGVQIEWRVHVANRKASFFSFNGQSGAETDPPYERRVGRPDVDVEKKGKGRGQPERLNRRNARVENRRSIEIDPGEVSIREPGSRELRDDTTAAPIKSLGEIHLDEQGRLLFLGGKGITEHLPNSSPIDDYANNDGWFDDMSDGVVRAFVTIPGRPTEAAQPAWVLVGPPDFAPGIGNPVSLYDTLWDLAVRHRLAFQAGGDPILEDLAVQQQEWREDIGEFSPDYEPSFADNIYPILARAVAARDVHEPPKSRPAYHGTVSDWTRLSSKAARQVREELFGRIRNPNSKDLNRLDMPRGLGDDYTTLDAFENDDPTVDPLPTAFLSFTKVQYGYLKAWADGRFKEDWKFDAARFAPIPDLQDLTPTGLDRAALENCVGGPFYPGIEVGWLVRRPQLYVEAFRLADVGLRLGPIELGPGFFSQQMALPWQADFYDCHKEEHTPEGSKEQTFYMWWTAQRPDDIRSEPKGSYRRWVRPFDDAVDPEAKHPDDIENLSRFEHMRTRWSELSFVVLVGDEFIEQK